MLVCPHNTAVAGNTSAFPGMYSEIFVCLCLSHTFENRNTLPASLAKM